MRRAVVLSGGGGKGAYQIGVWKALKRLHKKYHVVTGTSVGALNGAYMVQHDYRKAIYTWENMDYQTVFDETGEIKTKKDAISFYVKGVIKNKGLNPTKLEELIQNTVDEKKFRKSKIDYGLVTYNLTKMEPVSLKKSEIKYGELCDYLLASASCFPVFSKKEIENQNFIDGGYYDNVPFKLAEDFKVDEIIVVDLEAPGIKRNPKNVKEHLIWISPRNKLNSFLSFNAEESKKNICYGYNDTMKTFHRLDGNRFTFKRKQLQRYYERKKEIFIQTIKDTVYLENQTKPILRKFLDIEIFNILFQKNDEKKQELFYDIMEYAGLCFELDESKIYSVISYSVKLLKKANKEMSSVQNDGPKEKIKRLIYSKDRIIKMLELLTEKTSSSKEKLSIMAVLHPKDFLASCYLYILNNDSK